MRTPSSHFLSSVPALKIRKRSGSTRRRSAAATIDIAVSHPRDGRLQLTSRYFFADPKADVCQQLVGRIFEVEEVRAVEILASEAWAQIEYTNGAVPVREVVAKISRHLRTGANGAGAPYVNSLRDLPVAFADGAEGWRIVRHGRLLSTWEIKHELPGRIRFRNRLIRRQTALCAAIDRTLTRVLGIHRFRTNPQTATALILYDPEKVQRQQLIQILDQALIDGERPDHEQVRAEQPFTRQEPPWFSWEFTASGVSLVTSAIGDVFYPPLGLLSATAMLYTYRSIYRKCVRALVQEHKLTVDALVIGTNIAALLGGHFFLFCLTGFVFLWSRNLLAKVKQDSRADYTDIFRQQTRTVWVRVDGVEIETPLDAVKVDDLVSIAAGQVIPVDGHIAEGAATIDQHLLTGEAAPADKSVGDTVFALTVVLSGKICVRVEKTGAATAAAHIARVLDKTVDFKTGRQLRAEHVAERLVAPALLSGLGAWPLLGASAGAALVDSHPKYKTTLASSLGLLNYFKLAAREGLLIKDGRTLELLNEVDTVVFDKTGTLTLAQPHVRRLYTCSPYTANDILRLAAAAEQHQSHPIAAAILHVARARGLSLPPINEAEYKVGYGLTVTIGQSMVCVGSMRFIETDGTVIPRTMVDIQAQCHRQGHSLVLVAIDGHVAGAIELHTTIRPEAKRIIQGLRQRNLTSIYIISGDHEAPTRRLAEALGIERYFAETLPENKAALIEQLQQAGKITCYVGDGINDSIAMKKSHVSVSLRGASTLATDTAEVILLDESLNQFCRLFDVARERNTNMKMTMAAVYIPSLFCVGGVLLGSFVFAHARVLNLVGLVGSVCVAMLPLLTHRKAPTPTDGPELSGRQSPEVPVEECVIP